MSTSSRSSRLRLVLFVEGTSGKPLNDLWSRGVSRLLGLLPFERVVGIGKRHLVAMSNANMKLKHRTSAVSVGIDALIKRELDRQDFDCAVVAWDLVPPWDSGSDASACRWQETLLLYEGLARSEQLPLPWREQAQRRFDELIAREKPSLRPGVPRPAAHTVLSVCMEPEFEGLFLDEAGVKAVLGLRGKPPRGWPGTWDRIRDPRPSGTLEKAIEAARRVRPKPEVFRKIRQPLREAKHEWGHLLLTSATGGFQEGILKHSISNRLRALLTASGKQ